MGIFSTSKPYIIYLARVLLVIAIIGLAIWIVVATVRFASKSTDDETVNEPDTSQTEEAPDSSNDEEASDNSESSDDVPDVSSGSTDQPEEPEETNDANGAPPSSSDQNLPQTGPAADGALTAGLITLTGFGYWVSKSRLKQALLDK